MRSRSEPLAKVVQPGPLGEAALASMLAEELGEEVDRRLSRGLSGRDGW